MLTYLIRDITAERFSDWKFTLYQKGEIGIFKFTGYIHAYTLVLLLVPLYVSIHYLLRLIFVAHFADC